MAFCLATYNAGLAVGVLPYASERVPHVLTALGSLTVDVLFVQEFWLESHWQELVSALSHRLPYTLRPAPTLRAVPACRQEELAPLRQCAEAHCAGLADEALARCVVQRCASVALALPTPCLNCIASHPVGSLDAILGRCVAQGGPAPISPESGGLIAYGGSFGTGLLSRAPLEQRETLVFASSVNARGAVHATVRAGNLGKVHVFGAHLSPGGAEQEPQVRALLAWIHALAAEEPVILLGDLNTTPGSGLFRSFERAGLCEPDPLDQSATYHHDGLGTGRLPGSGYRLDHILMRGVVGHIRTHRVLDDTVTIVAEGRRISTTLSDHFGVLAIIDDA